MDFFCNFGQVEGKISLVGGGAPAFRPGPAGFGGAPCPAAGASVRHRPHPSDRPERPGGRRLGGTPPDPPRTPHAGARRTRGGPPRRSLQRPAAGGARLAFRGAYRLAGGQPGRLAVRGQPATRHGPQTARREGISRRPARRKEHRLAGLRRAQQTRLHLQRRRRDVPEPQPQGRLHADRHEYEAGVRLRQARLGGRRMDGHQARIHRRERRVPDGYDHLQPRFAEGQDQGRGHAAGRRLAGGRQREEDARQHLQHRTRQVHHLRRDRSPALLPGDDQGEGDSRQESGHGSRLPGPGRRSQSVRAPSRDS